MTFDDFWAAFPKASRPGSNKVAKPQCSVKFAKAAEKVGPDKIIKALHWWVKEWAKDGNKFVPHVATWLNQSMWEAAEEEPETIQESAEVVKTRAYLQEQQVKPDDKARLASNAKALRERMAQRRVM